MPDIEFYKQDRVIFLILPLKPLLVMIRITVVALSLLLVLPHAVSGQISGDLQLQNDYFQRDSAIGAFNTPQFDNLKSSVDGWLNTYYINEEQGFEAGLRLDVFNNSNILNPGTPYTAQGIGRWYISKKFDDLRLTGGYIYTQFGTGLTYRSYEERPLGIDNALFGLELNYDITDNWFIKGIAGKTKKQFDLYNSVVKGLNSEMVLQPSSDFYFIPGISVVNRTLDQGTMDVITSIINAYPVEERFVPKYNVYLGSAYGTISYKDVSLYTEYALKSNEAIQDINGSLINSNGQALYTSLSYSTKGLGITGQVRLLDNWVVRTSPNEILLNGIMNYLPSLTKQNSLRLTARYQAVAQELGEVGYQFNVTWSPAKGYTVTANYSDITDTESNQLFREIYADIEIRKKKYKLLLGGQYVQYNQEIFEFKPDVPMVEPITPFAEVTYKINRKQSLRMEMQYQYNEHDFGSWVYGLLEFNIAPKWSFTVSDMWNYEPLKTDEALHYPLIAGVFSHKAHRFSLSYVKQVEGIVCTGGVCRFEPAFSGFKTSLITSF